MNGGKSWTQISPDLTRTDSIVPPNVGIYCELAGGARAARRRRLHRRAVVRRHQPHLGGKRRRADSHDGRRRRALDRRHAARAARSRPWSKISIMDAGRFDAKTAYAAVNTLRLDDLRPHIYRTHDGGKTWTQIVNGIARRRDDQRRARRSEATRTAVRRIRDAGLGLVRRRRPLVVAAPQHAGDVDSRSRNQGRRHRRRHARPLVLDSRRHRAAASDHRVDSVAPTPRSSSRRRHTAFAGASTPTRRFRPTSRAARIRPTARSSTTTSAPNVRGDATLEIRRSERPRDSNVLEPRHVDGAGGPRQHAGVLDSPDAGAVGRAGISSLRVGSALRAAGRHERAAGPVSDLGDAARHAARAARPVGMRRGATRCDSPSAARRMCKLLTIKMDPRVKTPPAILAQKHAMAVALFDAIARDSVTASQIRDLRAKVGDVRGRVDASLAQTLSTYDAQLGALAGQAGGGRRGGGGGGAPAGGRGGRGAAAQPSIASTNAELLSALSLLDEADVELTAQGMASVLDAKRAADAVNARWTALRTTELAAVNAKLRAAGLPVWTSRGNESEGERRRQAERDDREVVLRGQPDEMREERDRGKRGCRQGDRSRGAGRTARQQKHRNEHDEHEPERIENEQILILMREHVVGRGPQKKNHAEQPGHQRPRPIRMLAATRVQPPRLVAATPSQRISAATTMPPSNSHVPKRGGASGSAPVASTERAPSRAERVDGIAPALSVTQCRDEVVQLPRQKHRLPLREVEVRWAAESDVHADHDRRQHLRQPQGVPPVRGSRQPRGFLSQRTAHRVVENVAHARRTVVAEVVVAVLEVFGLRVPRITAKTESCCSAVRSSSCATTERLK